MYVTTKSEGNTQIEYLVALGEEHVVEEVRPGPVALGHAALGLLHGGHGQRGALGQVGDQHHVEERQAGEVSEIEYLCQHYKPLHCTHLAKSLSFSFLTAATTCGYTA